MKHLLISLVIGALVAVGVYLAVALPLYSQISAPQPHPGVGLHHHPVDILSPDSAFVIAAPFGLAAFLASTLVIWLLQSWISRKDG